jgi:tetratricopeptide (TPR) repeat protein
LDVFCRLGVFAGGFTLEAAQAVASDDSIDAWDVLEHLGALIDKSLVAAIGESTPRYYLLETMRLFALERLIERDQVDAARTAHRDFYVSLAKSARDMMRSSRSAGLALFDIERDNLFLALAWTRPGEDGSQGLRLAFSMRFYWTSRGLIELGLQSVRSALAYGAASGACVSHLLEVELAASTFCCLVGRLDEGLEHACRADAYAHELRGDARFALSLCLSTQGEVHFLMGNVNEAERLGRQAIDLARQTEDPRAIAPALEVLASVHDRSGQYRLARDTQEEVLTLRKRIDGQGDPGKQLGTHLDLARTNVQLRDTGAALRHLREAYALLSRTDSELHGVIFLRIAAYFAACALGAECAVVLHAAHEAQRSRIGLACQLECAEAEYLRHVGDALPEAARLQGERAGREYTYEDALKEAARLCELG